MRGRLAGSRGPGGPRQCPSAPAGARGALDPFPGRKAEAGAQAERRTRAHPGLGKRRRVPSRHRGSRCAPQPREAAEAGAARPSPCPRLGAAPKGDPRRVGRPSQPPGAARPACVPSGSGEGGGGARTHHRGKVGAAEWGRPGKPAVVELAPCGVSGSERTGPQAPLDVDLGPVPGPLPPPALLCLPLGPVRALWGSPPISRLGCSPTAVPSAPFRSASCPPALGAVLGPAAAPSSHSPPPIHTPLDLEPGDQTFWVSPPPGWRGQAKARGAVGFFGGGLPPLPRPLTPRRDAGIRARGRALPTPAHGPHPPAHKGLSERGAGRAPLPAP